MILLLGASGYIGEAFANELKQRGVAFHPLSRKEVTSFPLLVDCLKRLKPEFLINAAGHTGKPNVDACETERAQTLLGNTLLPQTIGHACAVAGIPWGHVSSGCIYSGAKILQKDRSQMAEKDLTKAELGKLVAAKPEAICGFTELDPPNFSFRDPPCSFYSGTKALGEEAIAGIGESYLWRLRIPFDEIDGPRNYLSKIQRYAKVYDNVNSISHRADYVRACLDLWFTRAPFGIYNVTNPGFVTTRQVAQAVERVLKPDRKFEFWANDEEFYKHGAKTPRSNCVLDVSKLLAAGVKMRPVDEALEDSLKKWKKSED